MHDTATLAPSTDTSDADMLAAAMAADAGREIPTPSATAPAPESTPGPSAVSDDSGQDKANPEAKKTAPDATKPATEQKPEAPTKPETAFQKAAKEAERRDRSWKSLDAEKATFREEKTKIVNEVEALRREVASLRQQPAAATESAPVIKDEHGLTAAAYERAAKNYEAEGDSTMASLARTKAEALKAKQPAATGSAATPTSASVDEAWKAPEFQQRWAAEAAAIVQAEPALGDPSNPVFKAVGELVNHSPFAAFFKARPDGIRAAVEVAKLQLAAAEAVQLRKELETTKGEIMRLTKLTSPRGSLPSGQHASPKALSDMTSDEADAHVRALAAAADRGA